MKREFVLDKLMKALDQYYENRYNERVKEEDRDSCLRTVIESVDIVNYVKENLKK